MVYSMNLIFINNLNNIFNILHNIYMNILLIEIKINCISKIHLFIILTLIHNKLNQHKMTILK